jgi:hypothetical protein
MPRTPTEGQMKEWHRMRPRLTYANVVATLALFVALGGSIGLRGE